MTVDISSLLGGSALIILALSSVLVVAFGLQLFFILVTFLVQLLGRSGFSNSDDV